MELITSRVVGNAEFKKGFTHDTWSYSYPNLSFCCDVSTCVPFMCTSTAKAKAPFLPRELRREWREIDVTLRALEKLCHSNGKPHLNGIILPGPFRSQYRVSEEKCPAFEKFSFLNIKAMMLKTVLFSPICQIRFSKLPGFTRSFLPVEIGDFLRTSPFENPQKRAKTASGISLCSPS